jgi:hypothetical protein
VPEARAAERRLSFLADLKQDKVLKSMRMFAEEVMPAFKS